MFCGAQLSNLGSNPGQCSEISTESLYQLTQIAIRLANTARVIQITEVYSLCLFYDEVDSILQSTPLYNPSKVCKREMN